MAQGALFVCLFSSWSGMAWLVGPTILSGFIVVAHVISIHEVVCAKNVQRTNADGVAYGNFVRHPSHYLNATKVKLYLVHHVKACGVACVDNLSCFSFNIATTSGMNGYFLCELLASDKYNSTEVFLPLSDFDHYSIYVSSRNNTNFISVSLKYLAEVEIPLLTGDT